ncbi:MAG: molecular chaperone, partial [Moorella sp. (in: Bacteria)]|nr:molecular chaperone [Moorella sp. (in: firmicutes)]
FNTFTCLGVNLPGATIILELLDRIEQLQEEIEKLQRAR